MHSPCISPLTLSALECHRVKRAAVTSLMGSYVVSVQGESRQGRQRDDSEQTVHGAGLGFMASMLHSTAEAAPSRQTSGRTGFLWRHKAAAPVPEQALSWRGAVVAELRREGSAVAETAHRGGRTLVDGARSMRQTAAAALPAPAIEAAMPVAAVTVLTAALLILLQLTVRFLKSRSQRRPVWHLARGIPSSVMRLPSTSLLSPLALEVVGLVVQHKFAEQQDGEAAAQRLAQQKARFQSALVDSVDHRAAFEPTTYAEILEVVLGHGSHARCTQDVGCSPW